MGISNDYRIDALLRGADVRWNSNLSFGTPTEITYGFMDAVPSYFQQPGITNFSTQDFSTFLALDSAHRDLVRNEFAKISNAISGLKFTEVSDPNAAVTMIGALRYDVTALGDAMGYVPNGGDTNGSLNAAGDVWFNLNSVKYDLSRIYTYPDGTLADTGVNQFEDMALHEIGHTLGLKHPGNYTQYGGGGVGSNAPPYLPASEDNSTNTVMSYNGDYAGPELRPYDILALDFLYGAISPSNGQWLLATGGGSVILGSSLNELILPGQGTHSIDGGGGFDTVGYSGNRTNYTITKTAAGYTVTDTTISNSTDTLTNIDRLQFADQTVAFDINGDTVQVPNGLLIAPAVTSSTQQTILAIPTANTNVVGSGLDVINMGNQLSTAYNLTSNGDGSFNLLSTGSNNHVVGVIQVQFADKAVFIAAANSLNEQVALLYQGALGRTPDSGGLAFWARTAAALPATTIAMGVYGLSDASGNYSGSLSIAEGFTHSVEFSNKYGNLTNSQFATQLYANILDRTPDPGGFAYWQSQLNGGVSREHVLIGFAESIEAISNATVGYVGQNGTHPAWLLLN